VQDQDVLLTLGAGDIGQVSQQLAVNGCGDKHP
jgi:UDP-N-acetylmuramate-alanine ligase